MANFVRNEFPHQASQDRSEIAFSNGASFSSFSATDGSFKNTEHQFVRNGFLDATGQQQLAYTHSVETLIATRRPARPARHPEYIDYSQRLISYARWIRSSPGPACLCDAGFFFTNQDDLVRCFQCGFGLKDFSEGDDPLLEHVRYSGGCPYLLEYLGTAGLSAIKTKCQAKQAEAIEQRRSSVHCRHPQFQTYEARVSSFAGWPNYLTQKPEELAEAGLFYTGFEDHVRCFTCDGGLRRWDAEDDPWTEHCRWFPACQYAREKKGDEFIALVQALTEYNAEEPENLTNEEGTGSQGLVGAIEQMTLRDPTLKAVLNDHKNVCLEIGYDLVDFNAAVEDLRNMGTIRPTLEEILDILEVVQERKQSQQRAPELEQRHRGCEILLLKTLMTILDDTLETAKDIMSFLVKRRPEWFPNLTRKPTEKDLVTFAEAVGDNYRFLGLALGLRDTKLDQIFLDNPTTVMKTYNMLREWSEKKQLKATVSSLIETMKSCRSVKIDWNQIGEVCMDI